jgi:hypothetical protein
MALQAHLLAGLARSGHAVTARTAQRGRMIAVLAGMASQAIRRKAESGAGGVSPAIRTIPGKR